MNLFGKFFQSLKTTSPRKCDFCLDLVSHMASPFSVFCSSNKESSGFEKVDKTKMLREA